MNCNKARELIPGYVDDGLEGRDCALLESHLRSCSHCCGEVEQMRSMLNDLGSLCGCKSPVDCWDHVRQRVTDPSIHEPARRRWTLRPVVAVPMFAVLVLLAAFLIWPSSVDQPAPYAKTPSAPEYARYLSAHSQVGAHPAFADPDVSFAAAELESVSFRKNGNK